MPPEDQGIPPWVDFVMRQMREQFDGVNARLDGLVTRDAFNQEQLRVNEKFDAHGREISELRTSLAAEATARVTAEQTLAKERAAEQTERDRQQANRRWQVFAWFATPIVGAIVIWVLAGNLITGAA